MTSARPRSAAAPTVALVLTTAAWGSTFFLTRDLLETVPATDYLAVRFSIAAVVMFAVLWRQIRALTATQLRYAVALGGCYGFAQILQTVGLGHTSASASGFITGIYVVLTPLLAAGLARQRIGPLAWLATALAGTGLAVMSFNGLALGFGESITLASAVFYALHVLGLSAWSSSQSALGMAAVQVITIALLCLVAALPDGVTLPHSPSQWASVGYMAIIVGAGGLWAQTWAQAHLSATRAAIIMTLEPVFAAGFAVAFGGEVMTIRMAAGGVLILAAMTLVEVDPSARPAGVSAAEDPPAEMLHHEV